MFDFMLTCDGKGSSELTVAFVRGGRFLSVIPRVLADVYHSLGTQLPEALLALLPADFFSDESVAKDSVSPALSARSLASDAADGLQDLRSQAAKERR